MTVVDERVAAPATPVTLPDGHRLVPALIGRTVDTATHAWVPCPEWCTQDHSTDRQVAIEDIWHSGEYVDLEMPHRDGTELLAYFRLGLDPYSSDEAKRRPFILGEDGFTASGRYMDPEHVEAMCDKAIASLEKLRAMARVIQG
ncbi:DUF6907 domain-containing protein [Streptomyces sp. NBC_01614]|uniref:DUF6907 domain-containing protein n=1 Tax=Streptomyces sp. NBC_01614 TaxID=2975897 RepID=UPI00386F7423